MSLPTGAPNRTALVTGASSGIGVQLAHQLAKRGHGVTLVARREALLRGIADELADTYKVRTEVLICDLTDESARTGLRTATDEMGLEVSVLVNNAGFSTTGPVDRSDPAREVAMIRTDVEAVAHLCSLFLPSMVARGDGAVLNVASTAAFQPMPGQAGYAASKAFVLSYTHALRGEVADKGITVTVLCPGPVETGFADAAGFSGDETGAMPKFMWVSAEEVARHAIDGLARGRAVVIPGVGNKVTAVGGYLAPRRLLMPLMARQHPALRRGGRS